MKLYQKLKKFLSKNSDKKQASNEALIRTYCYSGIDELPIWNWNEIFKAGNLIYLYRPIFPLPKEDKQVLNKIYGEFYDSYLEHFGLNDKAQEIRDVRHRYIINMAAVLQGDKGAQTFVDIDKLELDGLTLDGGQNQTIWELKSKMEIALKINIDIKKCSVMEFYSYLKIISEMNNKIEE